MRLRPLLHVAHLWLGLAVGLVFAVCAGSGAVLAYQHELAALLDRDVRWEVTAGEVGFERAVEAVRRAHPDARLEVLWFPRRDVPAYEARLARGEQSFTVHVDPGTGALLMRPPPRSTLVSTVTELHTQLLAGEAGRWVVITTAGLGVLVLLSGLCLYAPSVRRLGALRVRTRRTGHVLAFDLHRVTGALAAPVLLVLCGTGVFLALPHVASAAAHAVLLRRPSALQDWTQVRAPPPPAGWTEAQRPTHAALLAAAHREVPGADTFYITFPSEPDEPVHVRLQTGEEPRPFGLVSRLVFDPYTGALLQVVDPRRMTGPEAFVHHWNASLHFGDFGGPLLQALWALAALAGVGLVISGLAVAWLKRCHRWARAAVGALRT